ncbi:aKG-HExxH-type peptide beta-hydroxylase [Asticcacaulis solisilvae]|uniref:aKG-HExxH-type peptide beta-hydroxylase n=1 Tax=Asticcacaulis solisilvae TaxID=1217274 RepID=UPI003FD7A056
MIVPPAESFVADLPTSCVAVHGQGEAAVATFRAWQAMHAMARTLMLIDMARPLVTAAAIAQAEAIADWLSAQPGEMVTDIMTSVDYAAWLCRTEEAGSVGALERGLLALPLVMVTHLGGIDAGRDWQAVLPGDEEVRPLGFAEALDGEGAVSIRIGAEGPRFEGSGMMFRPRTFLPLDIELYPTASVRELCRLHKVPDGGYRDTDPAGAAHGLLGALSLLADVWPDSLLDLAAFVKGIAAIETGTGSIFSASSASIPGAILVTIRAETMPEIVAECLVHEMSHVKLDALWAVHPLLDNGPEAIYRHPWRSDDRPMRGVLLGAHAFLNVGEMARRGCQGPHRQRFAGYFERLKTEVGIAMATLEAHARFTPAGQAVHADMVRTFDAWFRP